MRFSQLCIAFGARIASPIGLLVLIGVLSRLLPFSEMAVFLKGYAVCVILGALADGGVRLSLFSCVRRARSSGGVAFAKEYQEAAVIRKVFSFICAVVGFFAFSLLVDDASVATRLLFAGYALVLSASDINLILLRACNCNAAEALALIVEQVLSVCFAVFFCVFLGASAEYAVLGLICGGFARMALGREIVSRLDLIGSASRRPWLDVVRDLDVRSAVASVGGEVIATVFPRVPVILLGGMLEAEPYAVFAAIFTLLVRGEIVLTTVIQSAYGKRSSWGRRLDESSMACVALGGAYAIPIALVATEFSDLLTRVYLGESLVAYADYAAYAGLAVFLGYPLFTLRLVVQYGNGGMYVIVGAAIGILVQVLAYRTNMEGWQISLPYMLGCCAYSFILMYGFARVRRRNGGMA